MVNKAGPKARIRRKKPTEAPSNQCVAFLSRPEFGRRNTEMLKYKGYLGHAEYDDEARLFHGEVLGLKDVITFQGTEVEQLEKAFRDSVDDYLDFCQQRGETPDKPYSGRLMLRLPSHLHRKVHLQAQREGKSLNQWIAEQIEHTLDP